MATATLTEKLQDVAKTVREKIEDFDPEDVLSVAEETARDLRGQMSAGELRQKALTCVKDRPFTALGWTFVAGALLGVVIGRLAATPNPRTGDSLVS